MHLHAHNTMARLALKALHRYRPHANQLLPISQGGRLQVPGLAIHALWIPPFQHASGTGWSGPESVKCRVHSKTGDGQYLQRAVFFTMKSTSAISSLKTTASAIANAKHWRGFADIKFVIHLH